MPVSEIADGIHAIEFDHVRVFVLEGRPEGTVTLVDAAFPDDGEELADVLEAAFVDLDRILITHGNEVLLAGSIRAIEIPGHTVATTAFLFEADRTLIVGDTLGGSARPAAGLSRAAGRAVQRRQPRRCRIWSNCSTTRSIRSWSTPGRTSTRGPREAQRLAARSGVDAHVLVTPRKGSSNSIGYVTR